MLVGGVPARAGCAATYFNASAKPVVCVGHRPAHAAHPVRPHRNLRPRTRRISISAFRRGLGLGLSRLRSMAGSRVSSGHIQMLAVPSAVSMNGPSPHVSAARQSRAFLAWAQRHCHRPPRIVQRHWSGAHDPCPFDAGRLAGLRVGRGLDGTHEPHGSLPRRVDGPGWPSGRSRDRTMVYASWAKLLPGSSV